MFLWFLPCTFHLSFLQDKNSSGYLQSVFQFLFQRWLLWGTCLELQIRGGIPNNVLQEGCKDFQHLCVAFPVVRALWLQLSNAFHALTSPPLAKAALHWFCWGWGSLWLFSYFQTLLWNLLLLLWSGLKRLMSHIEPGAVVQQFWSWFFAILHKLP